MAIVRIILGIVIGVAVGIGVVMIGDMINHRIWPPPPEVQVTNPEAIAAYMRTAPITSLLALPVTWTIAAFAAAFSGAKIAARVWPGWVAGGVLFAATGLNLVMIPHPPWMLIAAVVLVPLAAFFGAKLARAQPGWWSHKPVSAAEKGG
jgi:hypothetical protein